MHRTIHALPLLSLLAAACTGGDNAPRPVGPDPAAGHEGHDHGPGEHAHADDQGGTSSTATPQPGEAHTRASGAPLAFTGPEGWVEEPPANNMRQSQYRLPAVEGDAKDAEVIVTYFGPSGAGDLDMNIDRWCSAFAQPDGSSTRETMRMSNRRVGGIAISEYDIRGTYLGMRGGEQNAGYRMVVALIESDHGPYYVKITGPEATVEKWLASFRSFVGAACS